jgi:large subunit ribosomal protein L13
MSRNVVDFYAILDIIFVMKTKVLKKSDIKRKWFVADAKGKVLGRFAAQVVRILTGKNKPDYSPHVDSGDFVIVINADKFRVTGKKMDEKIYYRHSMYPAGLKAISLKLQMERDPTKVIYHAVSGMLPKNRLRARRLKRLKLYVTPEHPHKTQSPEEVCI